MTRKTSRARTPEERELERKRAQLAELENQLAERETELATLQAELLAFEARYLGAVGVHYAELDDVVAQIAESLARRSPTNRTAHEQATQARARAEETRKTRIPPESSAGKAEFRPSAEFKSLYRELAKRIHPDLTTDEGERRRRESLMAEANRAYERGDEATLRRIFEEWTSRPEAVEGEGPGAELVRVIRQIAQVEARLQAIERALGEAQARELYRLKIQVEEGATKGRDILAELSLVLQDQIAEARERLRGAQARVE